MIDDNVFQTGIFIFKRMDFISQLLQISLHLVEFFSHICSSRCFLNLAAVYEKETERDREKKNNS